MSALQVASLTEATARSIPDLLYRGFGYTYFDEWMYHPDSILEKVRAGTHHFFVGLDEGGVARAIMGLRFPYPNKGVGDLGTLLTDPAIRGIESAQVLRQLLDAARETALHLVRQQGLRVLVSSEVTVHQLSQRLVANAGFVTTGMYLGWCPAWAERPRVQPADSSRGKKAGIRKMLHGRRTETVSVRPFLKLFEPYAVSLPARFEKLLRLLYEELELPVSFVAPAPPAGRSRVECSLNHRRSLALVELVEVGSDAPQRLVESVDHYVAGQVDLVHVALPLGAGDVEPAIEALVAKGCQYAALIPCYRDSDVVILQYLNHVDPNLGESQLHSDLAKRIFRTLRTGA